MKIQINSSFMEANTEIDFGKGIVIITPPLDEDYWIFRVPLSESQAIVGFPKFYTIGIGFQHEEDWNTNLPYRCSAEEIYNHIQHNKADDSITKEQCIEAIKTIQKHAAILMNSKKD